MKRPPRPEWNATRVDVRLDRTLHQWIEDSVDRTPAAVAVVAEEECLTYAELDERANRLAHRLRRLGVGGETRVGICAERSPGLMVGLLAILKAGGAYVPLDPGYPRERLELLLSDSGLPVLLTQGKLADRLPPSAAIPIDLDSTEEIDEPSTRPAPVAGPGELAYVIYTSGSTGRPKGAMNTHRAICNRLLWMQEAFGLDAGDRVLQKTPISFDVSVWELFWPLMAGARLVLARPGGHQDPAYLADRIVREGVTTLHFVPPMLRAFLEQPPAHGRFEECGATLRRVICSGEALPADLEQRFFERLPGAGLYNLYGPTEAAVDVTWWRCEASSARASVPIGRPIANTRIHLLDADLEPVPEGETGELYIGGVQVARGYFGRPELTAERFVPDPFSSRAGLEDGAEGGFDRDPDGWWREAGSRLYKTGDLARQLAGGEIEFLGRTDFQVKIRGFRIELGEIEAALDEHPAVAGSVVTVCAGPGAASGDPRLVAYVRPAPGEGETVRRWLRLEQAGRLASRAFHELPDGSLIVHQGRGETEFLWDEIFAARSYLRHGVELRDGDVVFDVGANVGLFSLFAGREAKVRLHAFEPIPPLFETLALNAELHGLEARVHPCGLAEAAGSAELTFYPHATLISGRFADGAEEREVVRAFLRGAGGASGSAPSEREIEDLLDERLESERHVSALRTLSEVIAEEGVEQIDLLKIDVEKSELAVLAGLREEDWPKVRQVVVEVHDLEGRLDRILALLRGHGFEVEVEQERGLARTGLYNLYARRPGAVSGGVSTATPEPAWTSPAQLVRDLKERLRARLPEHMVPAAFVLLEELPLSPNGKVDRKALPAPESVRHVEEREHAAPATPTEVALAEIWGEILGSGPIGAGDDFLELGGHSLLATQVIARVRERLGVELTLRDLFERPRLVHLAARIDEIDEKVGAVEASPIVAVPRTGDLPLSFAQERVWFLQQLDPAIQSYQFQARLRLRGALRPEALHRSLAEIVRRHEIFRTTFPTAGDRPVQRFFGVGAGDSSFAVELPRVDLSALPPERREAEAERVLWLECRRPFDVSRLPLVRWTLVRLAPEDHVWLHAEHHLVHDGWSFNRLLSELAALYAAELSGRPSPFPDLTLQFADWAVWQRGWMEGAEAAAQIEEWKLSLAGRTAILELPTDRPRPKRQSFRGAVERLEMPRPLCLELRAASRRQGLSLFMTMEAAFAALLSRVAGTDQVNVGSAVANRRWRETEALIGMLVDNVVLTNDLAGDPTVGELLRRVRRLCLETGARQDIPFDHVVEAVQPERDLAYNPLFQASFSFHDSPLDELRFPGLEVELAEGLSNGSAKFDLNVICIPRSEPRSTHSGPSDPRKGSEGGGITLLWEYSTALFDRATMTRMIGHFYRLLSAFALADGAQARVSELPLLSAEEIGQLTAWSRGRERGFEAGEGAATPMRAHERFEAWADRTPGALAVAGGGRTLTYGELETEANRLAWRLIGLGVGPESRVAVCLERSPELPLAQLAVLKAGGAYLPLDPGHPSVRLRYILEDSGVAILITSEALAPGLPSADLRVVLADVPEPGEDRSDRPDVPGCAESLAYVIYTSGSTGQPKGTELSHGGLANLVAWHRRAYSVGPEDRATQIASPAFDASVWETWPVLASGASLHFPPEEVRSSPADLLAWMAAGRTSIAFLPTPLAEACLDLEPEAVPEDLRLRAVLTGGDRLHPLRREPPFRLVNHYGPTEGTVVATCGEVEPGGEGGEAPSIGGPIDAFQVHVLDRALQPVPEGVVGELWVGGAGLARGYLRRPALTAERFLPDPFGVPASRLYRTGDLVRWRRGRLAFVGRTDHQVKIRGFRVELGEIEAALLGHGEVRSATVVVREEGGRRQLAAYAVPREGLGQAGDLGARLRAHLQARLPEVMVPASLVLLADLPLSPNGKVDGAALPAPEAARTAREGGAPITPGEELVAGVWSELLGEPVIGRDDSFFELGGHSLLASRMVARVRALLGVEIPLRSIFEEPTLRAFTHLLEAAKAERSGLTPGLAAPIPRVPRSGSLAASFSQQRLWFLDRLEPGSVAYNLTRAFRLEGDLHFAALAGALARIVDRQEALRSTFVEEGGEPRLAISPSCASVLPLLDLSRLGGADGRAGAAGEEAERIVRAEAARPYDLRRGPLFRAALLRLGERDHVLLLGLHHIVADGWSMGILLRELGELYRSDTKGRVADLPELAVQYADFAAWQRRELSGEVLAERLAWWKGELLGAPPVTELPLDRPRPAVQSYRGGRGSRGYGADLVSRFEAAARRLGATPFMALLAGFASLLSRHAGPAGTEDLVLGTPIANRARPEVEPLIGFFANTLALRVDLAGEPSFSEAARRVRESCLGAFARQDVPFERLVDEINPERSLSHAPLFQVLLALQNLPEVRLDLGEKVPMVSPVEIDKGYTQYDLALYLAPHEGGLLAQMTYASDSFEAATIERLLGQLAHLLSGIAEEPDRRLSELPLFGPEERAEILAFGNSTEAAIPETLLHQPFEAWARTTPGAVAVSGGGISLSYGELNAEANRLARRLRGQGVGPERRVAVCLERSPRLVVALLAVLKAGGAYVPLDPDYPLERLALVLEGSGAALLLSQESLAGRLPPHACRTLLLDELELSGEGPADLPGFAWPESLAYVLYTSGSTGRPQGVAVRQRGAVNFLASMAERPGLGSGDVLLAVTTIAFDIALLEIFLPLWRGARVELASREEASDGFRLRERLAASGATVMQATPATWRMLLEAGWVGSPGLKVLCGGEALPPELARELSLRTGELWNVYGPTETTVWSTVHLVRQADLSGTEARPIPLGSPVANTTVRLLDRFERGLEPVPPGAPGELYLGGEGLARGYLLEPRRTAERFVPDPFSATPGARLYRTGDLTRRRVEGGELEFLGRADHQVKIRGFRIELGEIEAVLGALADVRECAVVARETAPGALGLVAYLAVACAADSAEANLEAVREALHRKLPAYMVPQILIPLPALPLTPNGKVDRKALPAPEAKEVSRTRDVAGNPIEELLVRVWSELLGRPEVSLDRGFFELGGHSLLATRMLARLRTVLGVEVPLKILFEEPVLAGFAAKVESLISERVVLEAPPVRLPRTEPLPLSFAQRRLWFLDRLEPGASTYNLARAFRLTGPLKRAALAGALDALVLRHEALRAVFVEGPSELEPCQSFPEAAGLSLPLVDLSGIPAGRRSEASRLLTKEAWRPFDLARGPLVRVVVFRVEEEEHELLLALHHIVADAWSVGLLLRDLSAVYSRIAEGAVPVPRSPAIEQADFAAWERGRLAGGRLDELVSWWAERLAGAPPVLDLPLDRPRSERRGRRGHKTGLLLDREMTLDLERTARGLGLTPFMLSLASLGVLLSRYSGQLDLVVGAPIANRERAETEEVVGLFANILALRLDLSGDPSFAALGHRVRELALAAFAHQEVPFESLVEKLEVDRSLAYAPLFQTTLAFQNVPESVLDLAGLEVSMLELAPGRPQFDLSLVVQPLPQGAGLALSLRAAGDLFDPATTRRLLDHFHRLLVRVVASPGEATRVSEIPLLSSSEAQQLRDWNSTSAAYPANLCLHELVEAQAERTPRKVAVRFEGRELTYRELDRAAGLLARRLRASGAGPDGVVGVLAERSLELVVALLAVLKAGAAYLPLDPDYPAARLSWMLEDAGAPVLLAQEEILRSRGAVSSLRARVLALAPLAVPSAGEVAPGDDFRLPRAATPSSLAYVIYTSGSTGRPKGTMVPHGAIVNHLCWMNGALPLAPSDRVLQKTPFGFDASVWEIWAPLLAGSELVLAAPGEHREPTGLLRRLRSEGITVLQVVPSLLGALLEEGSFSACRTLRRVCCGGEVLTSTLVSAFFETFDERQVELHNFYGPTEATIEATTWACSRPDISDRGSSIPIGRPVANTTIQILGSGLEPQPVGACGELWIGGAQVARGYLGRPALTAERFLPDPFSSEPGARLYRTGDLARRLSSGEVVYLGRLDHQVKIRGFRIELGEIEAALAALPEVRECAVLAREIQPGSTSLVAYVSFHAGAAGRDDRLDTLRTSLGRKLPEHMVPGLYVELPALPLTPNGKVDRKALPAPEAGGEREFVAPRSPLEVEVARVWCEVLGVERVGIEDRFWDLGGHSLLATRVCARMAASFGVELPLQALFRSPTLGGFALEVGEAVLAATAEEFLEEELAFQEARV